MNTKQKKSGKFTAAAKSKGARRVCAGHSPRVSRGRGGSTTGNKNPDNEPTMEVVFGDVRLLTPRKTNAAQVRRNIRAGQLGLARAKDLIIKPGVTLEVVKGVPLYHADPDQPDLLVREIDGKRDRGKFVNGRFRKVGR